MLHYYKLRDDLLPPKPGQDVYGLRRGRGWPEECPPIRAHNTFGFDLLANFDVTFVKQPDGTWSAEPDVEVASDFDWSPREDSPGGPIVQRYAWFWERGQTVPHVIDDGVFEQIKHQVKLSTFLFLATDENEVLLMQDPPRHGDRPWRTVPTVARAATWDSISTRRPARTSAVWSGSMRPRSTTRRC